MAATFQEARPGADRPLARVSTRVDALELPTALWESSPSPTYPEGFKIQGPVTCLFFRFPKVAFYGFVIQKGSGSIPPGSVGFVTYVEDNGDPGGNQPDI